MPHYVTRSGLVRDEWGAEYPAATEIYIPDDAPPQPTGLLDQFGRPLYRVADRAPMGFRAGREGR